VHGLEPLRFVQGALQLDLVLLVVSALRQLDGHQPRLSRAVLRPDHQMRHALLERVDDDVRQLAVPSVGAVDTIADLEAHVSRLADDKPEEPARQTDPPCARARLEDRSCADATTVETSARAAERRRRLVRRSRPLADHTPTGTPEPVAARR
jgi:hypothetical protein